MQDRLPYVGALRAQCLNLCMARVQLSVPATPPPTNPFCQLVFPVTLRGMRPDERVGAYPRTLYGILRISRQEERIG